MMKRAICTTITDEDFKTCQQYHLKYNNALHVGILKLTQPNEFGEQINEIIEKNKRLTARVHEISAQRFAIEQKLQSIEEKNKLMEAKNDNNIPRTADALKAFILGCVGEAIPTTEKKKRNGARTNRTRRQKKEIRNRKTEARIR